MNTPNGGPDKHFSVGRFDPLFNRITNKWVRRIVVVLVVTLVFGLFGWTVGKALAMCSPDGATACPSTKYAVQHYRHGKLGHDHFTFQMFSNPKEARRMALHRIHHRINKTVAQAPNSKAAAVATSMTPRQWLGTLTGPRAECIGTGQYAPYSTGFNVCRYTGNGGGDTEKAVIGLISLTLCAGTAFLAWHTAGVSLLLTGAGGVTCMWEAWKGLR